MEQNNIKINVPVEVAKGTYSNMVIISHSSNEFVLDFLSNLPGGPTPTVAQRLILTPDNTKKLLFALQENVAKYEKQFGTIRSLERPAAGSTIAPFGVQ